MKTGRSKRVSLIIVMLFFLMIGSGCTDNSAGKKGVGEGETVSVRVGYFPNLTHAQALIGLSDGTFQRSLGDGVKIEENIFNAGPAEIEALLAGEIDLGYIGPVPAINGYVKSRGELCIIAGAADAGALLVARKGITINKVEDLSGKQVAIPQFGNTQDISLRNLMAQANLKDVTKGGTVTVIPVSNPDILTLIAKDQIDAALVPEPWGSRILKQASGQVVLDSKDIWRNGRYSTAVVIVNKTFLRDHPDLVEKWLAAHVELTERINKEPKNSKGVINNKIKVLTRKALPSDVLDTSFSRLIVTYNPEKDSVIEFVKLSVDNGYIKDNSDISALFDLTLLNKVLNAKGLQKVQ